MEQLQLMQPAYLRVKNFTPVQYVVQLKQRKSMKHHTHMMQD